MNRRRRTVRKIGASRQERTKCEETTRRECDLLCVSMIVLHILVHHDVADRLPREDVLRPHLRVVEDIHRTAATTAGNTQNQQESASAAAIFSSAIAQCGMF